MLEKYKKFVEISKDKSDLENRQLEILFSLIKDLGYSDNSLIPHCIIGTDLNHQLEYGLVKKFRVQYF